MPVAETQGLFFLAWAGAQAHYRCLGLLSTLADAESSLCLHCIFHLGPGGGCLALALCWVGISPSSWPASWPPETVSVHQAVKGSSGEQANPATAHPEPS